MLYKCKHKLTETYCSTIHVPLPHSCPQRWIRADCKMNGEWEGWTPSVSGGLVAFSHWWVRNHYTVGWVTLPISKGLPCRFLRTSSVFQTSRGLWLYRYLISNGLSWVTWSHEPLSLFFLSVHLPIHLVDFCGHPNDLEAVFCPSILYWVAPIFRYKHMLSASVGLFNWTKIPIIGKIRVSRNHEFVVHGCVTKVRAGNNIQPKASNVYVPILTITSITEKD